MSRAEAMVSGLSRYFTGEPCKRGHVAERSVSTRACAECERERTRNWARENKDKRSAYIEENRAAMRDWTREVWYAENRDKIAEQKRNRYAANPQKHRDRRKKYYWANRDVQLQKNLEWRVSNKDWLADYLNGNLHVWAKRTAARRARKLKATPAWLSEGQLDAIRKIYSECAMLSKQTGIAHHVDHIVPLKGRLVCGLHVPWNLQILTALDNLRKNNRLLPDDV